MKKKLKFVNFTKLNKKELLEILNLRNSYRIRSKMTNSEPISEEDHLRFCYNLDNDSTKLYLKILLDDEFVGVFDIQDIDSKKHTYTPGMYFTGDDKSIIAVHCSSAVSYLCLKMDIYYPNILIKKDNLQSLMFNTMKLENRIVREDSDFYYLTNDFLNLTLRSKEEIYSDLAFLDDLYEMEFDI